jgi:5-methylcytosine-specific restriction endonuclease McrA
MRSPGADILCAYCGLPGADESDHVIARQFFPPEHAYRGGLPQVPSCGTCNRKKQRVEDGPAVLFQFGAGAE